MVGKNERLTEDLVRHHFKADAYPRLSSEEQKSADPRITKCLAAASKQGTGIGKPEFLLHSPDAPGFVVVIECKASPSKHVSKVLSLTAPELKEAADRLVHSLRRSLEQTLAEERPTFLHLGDLDTNVLVHPAPILPA